MLSFLYIATLLLPAADLIPAPGTPQLRWRAGFELGADNTISLREAYFSLAPDRFRYGTGSTELIFQNATPASLTLSEPTATPFREYPSGRSITRYRSVSATNLYPNITSTFLLTGDNTFLWRLHCRQSPCAWDRIVIEAPRALSVNVFPFGLSVNLTTGRPPAQIFFGAPSSGAWRRISNNTFGLEPPTTNTIDIPLLLSDPQPRLRSGDFHALTLPDSLSSPPPYPDQPLRGCLTAIGPPLPCNDVAVLRANPAGDILWATVFIGRRHELLDGLALSPSGALYLHGRTNSSDFPTTPNAIQTRFAGSMPQLPRLGDLPPVLDLPPPFDSTAFGDMFISRLDPQSGTLLASTFLGSFTDEPASTLTPSTDASLFLVTSLLSGRPSLLPTTPTALITTCLPFCNQSYAARLSPNLDRLIFGTYLPPGTNATAVHTDQTLYLTGSSRTLPTTANAFLSNPDSRASAFLARLDPLGQRLLAATYLDPLFSSASALAVAPDGAVWVPAWQHDTRLWRVFLVSPDASRLLSTLPLTTQTLATDSQGRLHAVEGGLSGQIRCGLRYVVYSRAGQKLFDVPIPGAPTYRFLPGPLLDLNGIPHRLNESAPEPVLITCASNPTNFQNIEDIAPGMLLTLFGQHLGPTGTRVFLNGWEAPVLHTSASQVNIQIPWELATNSPVDIEVQSSFGASRLFTIPRVNPLHLLLFPTVLNSNGTINSSENPAPAGSTLTFWATGAGNLNPPAATGEILPLAPRPLAGSILVRPFNTSMPLEVLYSGAAPGFISGLTQINIRLPESFPTASTRFAFEVRTSDSLSVEISPLVYIRP